MPTELTQKLYTESYIQDIADAIRAKNDSEDTYKVSEMTQAINELFGFKAFLKNNADRLAQFFYSYDEMANYIVYYPQDGYYMFPILSKDNIEIQCSFGRRTDLRGYAVSGIHFATNIALAAEFNNGTSIADKYNNGIEKYYPILNGDISWYFQGYWRLTTKTSTWVNSDSQIFNLTPSHRVNPVIYNRYKNTALYKLIDLFNGTDIELSEIENITSVPADFDLDDITKGYYLIRNNTYCDIMACPSTYTDNVFVNSSGYLDSVSQLHYRTGEFRLPDYSYSKMSRSMSKITSKGLWASGGSPDTLDNVMYTTEDIKNSNGDVVLKANISLEDFKKIFVLS